MGDGLILLKVIVGVSVAAAVALAAVAGYVAVTVGAMEVPVLSGTLRPRAKPLSQQVISESQAVERKFQEAARDGATFYLVLTDRELTALLAARLDPAGPVREARVSVRPDGVSFVGTLNGQAPLPFSGTVQVAVEDGTVSLELTRLSVGNARLPSGVRDELRPVVAEALDLGESLQQAGAVSIQQVSLGEGSLTVVGIQGGGAAVSASALAHVREAAQAQGVGPVPMPPGGATAPYGAPVPGGEMPEVYLALGDSLAASQGAPSTNEGYVTRFRQYLAVSTGRSIGLVNLGRRKENTFTFREKQLPRALAEIRGRRDDGDPATRVSVVTLNLGANDLIRHMGTEDCRAAPRGDACQLRIQAALSTFELNFERTVSAIAAELEPGTEFYVLTVYNPYDLGVGTPLEEATNEVLGRVNAAIREAALAHGATVAEADEVMAGRASVWTHMLAKGDVHPNGLGHQALAYSLEEARRRRLGAH